MDLIRLCIFKSVHRASFWTFYRTSSGYPHSLACGPLPFSKSTVAHPVFPSLYHSDINSFFPSCIHFRGSLWLHFVHSNNPKFLPILRLVDYPHFNFICGFNSSLPHSKAYSENTGIRTRVSLWRGQPQQSANHNVQDTFQNLRFRSKFRDHPI